LLLFKLRRKKEKKEKEGKIWKFMDSLKIKLFLILDLKSCKNT